MKHVDDSHYVDITNFCKKFEFGLLVNLQAVSNKAIEEKNSLIRSVLPNTYLLEY